MDAAEEMHFCLLYLHPLLYHRVKVAYITFINISVSVEQGQQILALKDLLFCLARIYHKMAV